MPSRSAGAGHRWRSHDGQLDRQTAAGLGDEPSEEGGRKCVLVVNRLGRWKDERPHAAISARWQRQKMERENHERVSADDAEFRKPENSKAEIGPALGSADLVGRRHLEKTVSCTGPERLRCLWYRLRLTIAEMNYATRRKAEQQMRLP